LLSFWPRQRPRAGTVWGYGCKHLASAEALFDRQAGEVDALTALLLIDRDERKVLRSKGTNDPVTTANNFGW
jgi:hypothetical protein